MIDMMWCSVEIKCIEKYKRKLFIQMDMIICTKANYQKAFCLKIVIFVMNFKWKCCKHLVVNFVKVLLESFFSWKFHTIILYLQWVCILNYTYPRKCNVYCMMGKSFSYLIPMPNMKMAEFVQMEHAF